jgi:hypothetical protein
MRKLKLSVIFDKRAQDVITEATSLRVKEEIPDVFSVLGLF